MIRLTPKDTYKKLSDISLDYLVNDIKIKGLIFDFNGTLSKKSVISDDTYKFIKKALILGLKISILSNNIYINDTTLKTLGINISHKFAFKPLKKPFLDMAKKMKISPENIAVIGNNRISDIWGANRSGMYSIYIQDLNNVFHKNSVEKKLKNIGIKHVD